MNSRNRAAGWSTSAPWEIDLGEAGGADPKSDKCSPAGYLVDVCRGVRHLERCAVGGGCKSGGELNAAGLASGHGMDDERIAIELVVPQRVESGILGGGRHEWEGFHGWLRIGMITPILDTSFSSIG